ncbi:hypothetical protein [Legionella fairfieldensis]|uniref:hypothetical protein n=1 Tax=Legionella fairfieldensis TaxID=45064 RepID=UPI00048F7684|nr:hypothetical protein [Legionella fairfieldensis]
MAKNTPIELIDTKAHSDSLIFKQNDRQIIVTPDEIKKWLKSEESNNLPQNTKASSSIKEKNVTPYHTTTQILGQHGLKNEGDVIAFLKSPSGATTKKLIHDLLEQLTALKLEQNQQAYDKETRRHRFLASLLLAALYRKKEHVKKLNEAARQQVDDMLKRGKLAASQEINPASEFYQIKINNLSTICTSYDLSMQLIQTDLAEKIKESEALKNELNALEKESEQIDKRYKAFSTHLQKLAGHYMLLENQFSDSEKINQIEENIMTLTRLIDPQLDEIDTLIMNNRDEEAAELMLEINGYNLQIAGLNDMLAVIKANKLAYNADGQQVNSFKDADFILSKEQKIVKENGHYYLLRPGQDFSAMDAEEKIKAQQHFEQRKPEISSIKQLLAHNQSLEMNACNEKKEDLYKRSEIMQKELVDLSNQLNQLQAAQASAESALQQVSNTNIPTPKPVVKAQTTTEKTKRFYPSYEVILELMRTHPTQQAIDRLKNSLPNKAAQDAITNSIKPNTPIPQTTMNTLLANLERLAVSANKPAVTSIPNPLSRTLNQPSTAPTPFSMKPKNRPD